MASKSEESSESVPITVAEYNEMRQKLEDYCEIEQELNLARKNLAKVIINSTQSHFIITC